MAKYPQRAAKSSHRGETVYRVCYRCDEFYDEAGKRLGRAPDKSKALKEGALYSHGICVPCDD